MEATKNIQKETGATFTPIGLADYLANEILKVFPQNHSTPIKVLDPACGDGELLLSISKALKNEGFNLFKLIGRDLNSKFIDTSKSRMVDAQIDKIDIKQSDFLLDENDIKADIVIANPPYVRTQILGEKKAQELATKYNLKGRVDLYYPFIIEMTNSLKEGGVLGVITSNRYLVTKSGESIRKFLSHNYDIIKIVDLGDTKLFENAAVLPAIFIGRKKAVTASPISGAKFLKIYEQKSLNGGTVKKAQSIYDVLRSNKSNTFQVEEKYYKQTGGILTYHDNDNNWQFLTEKEQNWLSLIDQASRYRIKDIAKVRVGVKTTADKVFIGDQWDELNEDMKPEEELLRPLISQNNIQKWQNPFSSNHKILYTHFSDKGRKKVIDIDNYPKAKNYLNAHKKQLSSRTYVIKAGRKWFEIWVPQQPRLWAKPNLVFPDISEIPKFYFNVEGAIVNGNCYWISSEDTGSIDLLLLIQGIANSKVIAKYHDLRFNNRLYAGRRRYFTQYVENYPLPDPNSKEAKDIIAIVKELNAASKTNNPVDSLENKLNTLVLKAYGIKSLSPLD